MKAVKKHMFSWIYIAGLVLVTAIVAFRTPGLTAGIHCAEETASFGTQAATAAATPAPEPAPLQTPAPVPEPSPEPVYELEICGVRVMSDASELDLSGVKITDAEALKSELSELKRLERVTMIHCGLDDTAMEELQREFPGVRFVWIAHIGACGVRTDTTYFTIYNPYERLWSNASLDGFRYCPDIEALDLGHGIAGYSPDGSYLRYMPRLRYLILYMAPYRTLPELAELKELEYLELMRSGITDISPLSGCQNLRHLNLCNTYSLADKTAALDVLCGMKQLERLWISDDLFTDEQVARLYEALPETNIHLAHGFGDICVNDGGWRLDESYFRMRDALHMFYMTDNGGVQLYNPYTGERSKYENTNPF